MTLFTEDVKISKYSKDSKPETGEMLLVCRGNAKSGTESICASVAPLAWEDVTENLHIRSHIMDWLSGQRAKLLRHFESVGHCHQDILSVEGIATALDAEAALSQQEVKAWLEQQEQVQTLRATFALKFGWGNTTHFSEIQEKKLGQAYNAVRDLLVEVSTARKPTQKQLDSAANVVNLFEESVTATRLAARIAEMKKRAAESSSDLLDSLGL